MSQENVEFVQAMYADFEHGGWDGVLGHLPPDIEWEADPRHPKAAAYRGREELRAFLRELEEPFEHTVVEVDRLIENDDHVVAFLDVTRRPRGSSAEIEIHVAMVWTFLDGKPVRSRFFAERPQALKAAGLS